MKYDFIIFYDVKGEIELIVIGGGLVNVDWMVLEINIFNSVSFSWIGVDI